MTTRAHFNGIGKPVKFRTRYHRRCELCGRSRAVYRKFRMCRICLRILAHQGKVPGLKKASW